MTKAVENGRKAHWSVWVTLLQLIVGGVILYTAFLRPDIGLTAITAGFCGNLIIALAYILVEGFETDNHNRRLPEEIPLPPPAPKTGG